MSLEDPTKQADWLNQHIPHRIRAALGGTELLEYILYQLPLTAEEKNSKRDFCRDMAMWEGRHAAVRWMIDFVGINSDKEGKPKPTARRLGKGRKYDVDINDLPGGVYFDLTSSEALVLSKIWQGCSQATSHPTEGSNHPNIEEPQLRTAIDILIRHLKKTIYADQSKPLRI